MGENKWDLRSRHTFSEVVIDTDEIMVDENDDDEDFDDEAMIEDEYEEKDDE